VAGCETTVGRGISVDRKTAVDLPSGNFTVRFWEHGHGAFVDLPSYKMSGWWFQTSIL